MSNSNVILDVKNTVNAVRRSIEDATHEEKVDFFDQIDVLREEMGVTRDIYSSQLFDYHIGVGAINQMVDSVQEEDDWVPIGMAAELIGKSVSTIDRRIKNKEIGLQWREKGGRQVKYVRLSEARKIELKAEPTHVGPRPKKFRKAKDFENAARHKTVMNILSDGREHLVRDVIDKLTSENDFTFNKDRNGTAIQIIKSLVDNKKILWRTGEEETKNPSMTSFIYLPGQSRMGLFASRNTHAW